MLELNKSKENSAKLCSTVETLLLCSHLELPLRGKCDSGNIFSKKDESDGVFRTKIVEKVNRAWFFSVLADETTDVARTGQMSLCLRYIDTDSCTLRDDFIGFSPVTDLSVQGVAGTIIKQLKESGLNLNVMVEQGYNGAAIMNGHLNGAQAIIQKDYPLALHVHLVNALKELQNSLNKETSESAHKLLTNVLKTESILSLFTSTEILTYTLPLCQYLQEVGGEISSNIPCRVARQRDRDNVPAATAEEYYRKSVYIPFIDYVRSHLSDRFAKHRDIVTSLQQVVTSKLTSQTEVLNLKRCIELYSGVLRDANSLNSELDITERTSNALQERFLTVPELYPNICKLLEILATLPVSTATAERSFSTMKRVKTYLRKSTSDTHLTELALLSIHKQMKIEPKDVVDQFALKPRRKN
ncbi:hypothetical protein PR048_008494 [Dryococelus australis]|uniref:HAT C-terminal dimerisation domain-containing protein n=1 Tax=Dryococelus australis TaxID=614101 RepID=A0ABQ9HY69_9NEOP|nr:hypothetical protein PR048_008494 [Dryococelus australis]